MATLVSPGVAVSIIDESFYVGAGPGTVPLIIFATGQDKLTPSQDGYAYGTLASQAGSLNLMTSQRELLQTYGMPDFKSINGNPLHGNPLNEYGLLTAHSFLSMASRAYTLRADINLSELEPSNQEPSAPPKNGTFWLNPTTSNLGLYEYDGTKWVKQVVFISEQTDSAGVPTDMPGNSKYAMTVGRIVDNLGEFVSENKFWIRRNGLIVPIDSDLPVDRQYSRVYPTKRLDKVALLSAGDVWINLADIDYKVSSYDATIRDFIEESVPFFKSPNAALEWYGDNLRVGDLYGHYDYKVDYDPDLDGVIVNPTFEHVLYRYNGNDIVELVSTLNWDGTVNATISVRGSEDTSIAISSVSAYDAATQINTVLSGNSETEIIAVATSNGVLKLRNLKGRRIGIDNGASAGFTDGVYSNWIKLTYEGSAAEPTGDLADGTLWISSEYLVDLLINDGVGNWAELPGDMYVQPSEPDSPIAGDVWVDTDDVTGYPIIRVYTNTGDWRLVDQTDQSTPNGILFGDARISPSHKIDGDAPDPLSYPEGMYLWNTRYSAGVVKRWTLDHVEYYADETLTESPHRWVNYTGNDYDGSIITGEEAVRKVVARALQAVVANNLDIRSESVFYNLIVCPGFPELIDEMVTLNIDKKEVAFVVGDTPMDLPATGTDLQRWATNYYGAAENGRKGLLSADEYLGIYYPSGLATNLTGESVVVPPSHMALRTIAYNDQVAYQWFAPAGYSRGAVSNAVSVGYITEEREYLPVELGQGLRDVLYTNNINPIRFVPNRGLVVWGQKTRSPVASALDRINVARLCNYIRYQVDQLAQPFMFEPNDQITRTNVKAAYESFLSSLVTLRGLYDYLVVCDSSNNTPDRIDRNELWIDIAIQPVKAIEFIYIPIRIKSTGASLSG